MEPIDGYSDTFSMPIDAHSEEFQKRRDAVMYRMMEIPGFKSENILSAKIENNGMLVLQLKNGKTEKFPILLAWENGLKPESEQRKILEKERSEVAIKQKTIQEETKLQEEIAKETFFDQSVTAEYVSNVAGIGTSAA